MQENPSFEETIHMDIKDIHIDKKGTLKSKAVLALGLIAFWVPFIPAIVALFLIPSARREINNSSGKLTGLKMLKWGKILAIATIILDFIGLITLITIFTVFGDLIVKACELDPQYCYLKEFVIS